MPAGTGNVRGKYPSAMEKGGLYYQDKACPVQRTAKPYPNLEVTNAGVASICPMAPLVQGIKAGTSATGKHIVDSRNAAILKVPVNTPIPTLGQPGVIHDIYLSWTLAFY